MLLIWNIRFVASQQSAVNLGPSEYNREGPENGWARLVSVWAGEMIGPSEGPECFVFRTTGELKGPNAMYVVLKKQGPQFNELGSLVSQPSEGPDRDVTGEVLDSNAMLARMQRCVTWG